MSIVNGRKAPIVGVLVAKVGTGLIYFWGRGPRGYATCFIFRAYHSSGSG